MATARLYPPEEPRLTAEELLAMGPDAPYVLIEGRLVPEMPSGDRSSKIAAKISARLLIYADWGRLGDVWGADGGFILQRDQIGRAHV